MKRFTLFDAAIAAFVLVLIPVAYGTYLLFAGVSFVFVQRRVKETRGLTLEAV